jgi:membrane protease YdiL (CAAX protease family)
MTVDNTGSLSAQLRGFGLIGLLAIAAIIAVDVIGKPMSALAVLLWVRASRTPWSELGFVGPRSWTVAIMGGIAIGVALKLLMKSVVMPLLSAPAVNEAYHFLEGNRAAIPAMLYAIVVGAGFGEETLFRGFMFERLRRLLGTKPWPQVAIVLFTSLLFGLAHYADQGLPGTQQGIIVGVVYSALYLYTRSLYPVMIAHVAFDLTAWWIIYHGLETEVARLFFH